MMLFNMRAIMILLLASMQNWEICGLPTTSTSWNQGDPMKGIQNKEGFLGIEEDKIIKRASLWDRVRGKKIIEDAPKQTYQYKKLEKEGDHSQHAEHSGETSSHHSEGQISESSLHGSTRKPTPSWLQRGNFPEHGSLPLNTSSQPPSGQLTVQSLSTGGRKIEDKVNQLQGGVQHRERFRDGFTLIRGAKAAKKVLRQGAKLDKMDSKPPSTLRTVINAIPRKVTQVQYNKNLKTLGRVEKDVNINMRSGRMNKNVLRDIAETAHRINDIKIELKNEKKAKKASKGSL
ncbi:uncharacterized protein FA14DRAFT_183757 [Meira miltonrushii]|uniref:Uncharacterized protein n=1 Tax=Meira miltonrushii TaxID=1280837 RepID=A0A316VM95_9BASI|nr:uncharacterized protein FA14DRAFT_183757 [Meira miltonrushii]PWN38208.1 hypothetical protein FA14DRAFT_183757 [Meira miltonrushii]